MDVKEVIFKDAYLVTPRSRNAGPFGVWVVLIAIGFIAVGGWALNQYYFEPKRNEQVVSDAILRLDSLGDNHQKSWVKAMQTMSGSDKALNEIWLLNTVFKSSETNKRDYLPALLAALNMGRKLGLPEAHLIYAKHLRDGNLGEANIEDALKIFDEVRSKAETGVRAGDPVSLITIAEIYKNGLGVSIDLKKSLELATRAAPLLDGERLADQAWDLSRSVGYFEGVTDKSMLDQIIEKLINAKSMHGPLILMTLSCRQEGESKTAKTAISKNVLAVAEPIGKNTKGEGDTIACNEDRLKQAMDQKINLANFAYASNVIVQGGSLGRAKGILNDGRFGDSLERQKLNALLDVSLADSDQALLGAIKSLWAMSKGSEEIMFHPFEIYMGAFVAIGFPVHYFLGTNRSSAQLENFLVAVQAISLLKGGDDNFSKQLLNEVDLINLKPLLGSPTIAERSRIIFEAIRDDLSIASFKFPAGLRSNSAERKKKELAREEISLISTSGTNQQKASPLGQNRLVDPEQQDRTGYLKGQPRTAIGGMSTFTVDNRQGGSDAVARIYLNGKKPAVRSMFVKHGDTFKAESILPGTYVFRYRFIGSEDTYEAEKEFLLTQTETDSGARYSNVTVTLFKVKDGNMTTRKVDPNNF